MFKKVAFTMYPVKDSKRARAFHEGTLGLTVRSHSESGVWTEYDLPGGGCPALFAHDSIQPSADTQLAAWYRADPVGARTHHDAEAPVTPQLPLRAEPMRVSG